ncbi:MAG: hypothetical protein H0X25_12025 [Acidobacteriales bacterium]|nr:hypothetical protein [Terriglobales bacterium]
MKRRETVPQSTRELTLLIQEGCLVARDAAVNVADFIENSSKMAFLTVKDCEQELDNIERSVDDKITAAITEVTEEEARQLLACLKFSTDLERIGDLTWTAAKRLQGLTASLLKEDTADFSAMAKMLEKMLDRIRQGFSTHDVECANWVLQNDAHINYTCRMVFNRHLEGTKKRDREYSTNLLFVAQAFERAGDHAKNLAEEIIHLVEGRSLRHEIKRRRPKS